jgi:hypothetical protein
MHRVTYPKAVARWPTLLLDVLDGQLPNPAEPILANDYVTFALLIYQLVRDTKMHSGS